RATDRHHGVQDAHGVAAHETDEQIQDLPARDLVEVADDAEIEQPELAIVPDEDVAWMGVAVEHAVHEHHLEHQIGAAASEQAAVERRAVLGGDPRDLHAVHEFQRQATGGGALPENLRHAHHRVAREHALEALALAALALQIELTYERARELVHQAERVI